jgi:anti-sigma factor RsiW
MTEEQQLKLQAFLDGELPERDAREVAAWVARDAEATDLLAELRNTRKALADFEPAVKLPESREFYWSKIQREIQRLEPVQAPAESGSLFALLRRLLVPIGAVAVLAIVGVLAFRQFGPQSGGTPRAQVSAMLADVGAFTYRDQSQGMTVIWLSYPAEKKLADHPPASTLPTK